MNIELLKQKSEEIKQYIDSFDMAVKEDKIIINELWKAHSSIRSIIWREEMDLHHKERLETKVIDGYEIVVPDFMNNLSDNTELKIINGELYSLPTEFKEDKDGSFHIRSYAYIKLDENKHVRLTVSMLGNDRFGDRIFTNSYYFKKIESFNSYYSKDYGKNNRFPDTFKEYVDVIIDEFNKLDGVEGFNPIDK